MSDRAGPIPAVILAGERPGGSALAQAFGVAAGVLVPVAGEPAIARVFAALRASAWIDGGVLCGPAQAIVADSPTLQMLLAPGDFSWLAPQGGPAASTMAALERLDRFPTLVTTGDHALLTAALVDDFCRQAAARTEDVLVGLVPYPLVMATFPDTRRTALRLAGGCYCGSNLFCFRHRDGLAAASFWRQLEAWRKQPWKMAQQLGLGTALRYLSGRLSLAQALAVISKKSGCWVGFIELTEPRAAVDVDSVADQQLADRLLRSEA